MLTLIGLAGVFSSVAVARQESSSRDDVLNYREESSFGSINPDEPAKPAVKESYPRRVGPPAPEAIEESSEKSSEKTTPLRPKYRDVYEQAAKRDRSYGDEESVAVSLGVGFGFKSFSGNIGLSVPLNRYVGWGLSGFYTSRTKNDEAEVTSGGGFDLILKVPNATPLTPFVSAGPGFESWRRSKDQNKGKGLEVFDDDNSPTGNWGVGASLRLARYVALVGALRSTTYFDRPPRKFTDDHVEREPRTQERFDLGFAFIF